jgi:hypothetical protein
MTAKKRGGKVEGFIMIAILVGIGYWMFREGKRLGSRKAFGVGRRVGRRRRR